VLELTVGGHTILLGEHTSTLTELSTTPSTQGCMITQLQHKLAALEVEKKKKEEKIGEDDDGGGKRGF
jgi:hypothetical protein